jgi:hypothetical protein
VRNRASTVRIDSSSTYLRVMTSPMVIHNHYQLVGRTMKELGI